MALKSPSEKNSPELESYSLLHLALALVRVWGHSLESENEPPVTDHSLETEDKLPVPVPVLNYGSDGWEPEPGNESSEKPLLVLLPETVTKDHMKEPSEWRISAVMTETSQGMGDDISESAPEKVTENGVHGGVLL
ncbi:uncharacterized protein DS421_7g200550 [Arachis hypogaea]|nr:uncharacterized protein DS421_7g200550 [Arachis hypogaea]